MESITCNDTINQREELVHSELEYGVALSLLNVLRTSNAGTGLYFYMGNPRDYYKRNGVKAHD